MAEFWTVLDRSFEDPDREGTASRALNSLRQGKDEFSVYYAEFSRLKTDVQWNDAAYINILRTNCSQAIRDVLRNRFEPLPETLTAVATLFNRIDLHNRQWESDNAGRRTIYASPKPPNKPVAPVVPLSQRTTANPNWTGPAPMDLSASARATARAAKRAEAPAKKLCYTCSSPDHMRSECPVQARYDQAQALRAAATVEPTGGSEPQAEAATQPAGNEQPGN